MNDIEKKNKNKNSLCQRSVDQKKYKTIYRGRQKIGLKKNFLTNHIEFFYI